MTRQEEKEKRFKAYLKSNLYSISSAYKNPSKIKLSAERVILDDMLDVAGMRYRIVHYGKFHFTCAYCYRMDNKVIFRYITHTTKTDYILTGQEIKELGL